MISKFSIFNSQLTGPNSPTVSFETKSLALKCAPACHRCAPVALKCAPLRARGTKMRAHARRGTRKNHPNRTEDIKNAEVIYVSSLIRLWTRPCDSGRIQQNLIFKEGSKR